MPSAALDALTQVAATIPEDVRDAAVRSVAPGSRPEMMTLPQIARCLGVRGLAQCWNVPDVLITDRIGATPCRAEDLMAPNPYAANGYDAFAAAYTPAPANLNAPGCACKVGRGMGSLDDGEIDLPEDGDPNPPTPAPQMADGWPAAVPFRAGNWNYDKCEYTLAQGDTLSGVARRYLGRPDRWLEIWQLQPFRWTYKPDPSSKNPGRPIKEGDVFIMPKEACENAKLMVKQGAPSAPATGGAPGTQPGASKDGIHESAPMNPDTKKKLLIGGAIVAGVVVVGGVAYAMT